MKFVKSYISIHTTNKIKKIGTALELGEALAYQGGMDNTMVQVLTTHTQTNKFHPILKRNSRMLSRVSQSIFQELITLI